MYGERLSNPFLQQRTDPSEANSEIRRFNEAVSDLLTDARRRSDELGLELANLQEYLDAQPTGELGRLRKQELVRTLERARELVTQISSTEQPSPPGLESRLKDLEDLVANMSKELASIEQQLKAIRQDL